MYKLSRHRALSTKHYTVAQAQEMIIREAWDFGFEVIELKKAYGRVLAENIFADRNYPPFNRSAVDGFAIRAKDLLDEDEFEIIEEVHAGAVARNTVGNKTAIKVMTGAPVPAGADAVIKVEDSEITEHTVVFSLQKVKQFLNISLEGEDTKKGALVIPKNEVCTPAVISSLATLGKSFVKVFKQPIVAIISTGNEVKDIDERILPYQIRDANSYTLAVFLASYGITPAYQIIVPDDKEKLKDAFEKVADADIIILSGGVSMGDADFVPEVLFEKGVHKIFHKAAIKPGKPIWFGTTDTNVVFALPGNPFSIQVGFKVFVEPYLRSCLGLKTLKSIKLPLKGNKKKKTDFDEYFPCRITDSSLEIISINGSGDIKAALSSDGIAIHPANSGEISDGEMVEFYFWSHVF